MIKLQERPTKSVPGITSIFISFNYKQEIVDAIKSLDCKVYDKKNNEWEVPITHLASLIDKLSNYDEIELTCMKENKTKEVQDIKLGKHKTKPFKYQEEAIKYGLVHNNWLLLDGMGLGKTGTAIWLAEELKRKEKIKHCLVICGINNLKYNWEKQIAEHSNLSSMILGQKITKTGRKVIGSVKDRVTQLLHPIKEFFIITNIETLREESVIKALEKGKNEIDMIVLDEAHCCKNPQSEQGKHLLKLNKAKHKLGMTGTLLLNDPLDAYVPLKWIGIEKSNYTTFKSHYCTYAGPFHNILIGYKNLPLLKAQLNECSLRRTKDLLDLPPKNIIEEIIEMDDKQERFYKNIEAGIIDEVDKVKMTTTSLLSMVARLRQASACPSILTTENIPSAKLDRACDLVDQLVSEGEKVVIFSTFKDSVYELGKRLNKYKPSIVTGDIKDEEASKAIDDFQNNEDNKVFIATWQKCGTGITLTASSYMIFIDTPWTDAVFQQACDRIYRIGTKRPVFIYNLITKDTIDERVSDILKDKKAISEYVIDNQISKTGFESLKKYIKDLK